MRTVKEIATELRISIGAVYRLITTGQLQCHRFGKTIRISQQQLDEFLECSTSCDVEPEALSGSLKRL